MPHLIRPFLERTSLRACRDEVAHAHSFLVSGAVDAVARLSALGDGDTWGQSAKRIRVEWDEEKVPAGIDSHGGSHNLMEVVNQCATVERLLATLDACMREYPDHDVVRCHPTTSSHKASETPYPDNDLVLEGPQGTLLRFEITDIAGEGDSNQKERKSLICLNVLRSGKTVADRVQIDQWPRGRCFIATSNEFAEHLMRRKTLHHYRYDEGPDCAGTTRVLEVLQNETR